MERADEPKADFCRGEKDADEDKGEGDYPSSRVKLAAGRLNGTIAELSLRVNSGSLSFHFEAQDADYEDRVGQEEHLYDPEWRQYPGIPGVSRVGHEWRNYP